MGGQSWGDPLLTDSDVYLIQSQDASGWEESGGGTLFAPNADGLQMLMVKPHGEGSGSRGPTVPPGGGTR